MKFIVLMMLFVSFLSYGKSETLHVSIFELLGKNATVDGRMVNVVGYLQKNGSYYSLYPYQTDTTLMDSSRSLVIDTVHGNRIDLSNCANQYVQVSASFSVSERPLPNVLHTLSSVMVRDRDNKYMGYSPCGR